MSIMINAIIVDDEPRGQSSLQKLLQQNCPEVQVLAVTFDKAAVAKEFAARRKLQWPVLADGRALVDASGVVGVPTFILVGPDGKVRARSLSVGISGKGKTLDVAMLSRWVADNRKPAPGN